ncbi:inositol monophosphatase family protein [Nocardioides astragali]|uniref:Inositol monophosphatase family protein n=1 Tax=Nocardioides astragali TaxID=1776736 RepID=A0ABW2N5F3_9ACTN|nr:inositol monophosphatase family protein [Nocardioides astragali]
MNQIVVAKGILVQSHCDGRSLELVSPWVKCARSRRCRCLKKASTSTPRDLSTAHLSAPSSPPVSDFRAVFSPRVESTTLALAWDASGQRLGYVTDGRHKGSVHFAAGIALCRAAGCVISDVDGNAVHSGAVIIAARDLAPHATLMQLVARHRSS